MKGWKGSAGQFFVFKFLKVSKGVGCCCLFESVLLHGLAQDLFNLGKRLKLHLLTKEPLPKGVGHGEESQKAEGPPAGNGKREAKHLDKRE